MHRGFANIHIRLPHRISFVYFSPPKDQEGNSVVSAVCTLFIVITTQAECGTNQSIIQLHNLLFKLMLTLTLLTWTIWRAPTNASKWRMGFNSAFKGLIVPFDVSMSYLASFPFSFGAAAQRGIWPPSFTRFLDRTQRRTTVGRTPLDE